MAAHIQVSNYADFKTVVDMLPSAGAVGTTPPLSYGATFFQNIAGGTLSYIWFFSKDGNFIVSNCPSVAGSAAFTLPGSFATDFPLAVAITSAGAPPGAGQTAVPGLLLI
jgi:hypothetical protein